MCKAPKPPEKKEPKKVQFLRNKYLDEFVGDSSAVKSIKTGRDSLRIPTGVPAIGGRQPGESLVPNTQSTGQLPVEPAANPANVVPARGDFRPIGRSGPNRVR